MHYLKKNVIRQRWGFRPLTLYNLLWLGGKRLYAVA